MPHRNEFRAYMKAASRTADRPDDRHLSEAQVIAFCQEQMPSAEREAARAHLLACAACLQLFRDVNDFFDPPREDEEELSAPQLTADWQALWTRVQRLAASNVIRVNFAARRPVVTRATLALAACLLLSVGLTGWLARQWRQERRAGAEARASIAQLRAAQQELAQQLNERQHATVDQLAQEREKRLAAEAQLAQLQTQTASLPQNIAVYSSRLSAERGAGDELEIAVPANAQVAILQLLKSNPYEFTEYAVEVLDQRGRKVQEISGVRPVGDAGALSLTLNRAALQAGKYRLRLSGQRGQARRQLGEYDLRVSIAR